MSSSTFTTGVRRYLFGIRNGNSIKIELSQLVNKKQMEPGSMKLFGPQIMQSHDKIIPPQTNKFNDKMENLLLTLKIRGSDEAALDNYTRFMRRAGTVLNLRVSGKLINPFPINRQTLIEPPHVQGNLKVYDLQTHSRVLQVREFTGETAGIFLEYVQNNLPDGVSIAIEHTDIGPFLEYIHYFEKQQ